MDVHSLPDSARNMIMNELAEGESVLYLERPIPRDKLPIFAYFPFLIGLLWSGFLTFFFSDLFSTFNQPPGAKVQVPSAGERIFTVIFCIPFVIVGIALLTSPIWIRMRLRKTASKTFYLVTDRRVLVFDGGYRGEDALTLVSEVLQPRFSRGIDIRSYTWNKIGSIRKILRVDGSGDLIFGEPLFTIAIFLMREIHRDGFYSIPNVAEAEKILTTRIQAAEKPA